MAKVTSYFTRLAQGPRIGRDGLTMAERWERMSSEGRKAHMLLPPCPKCGPNRGGGVFEDGLCAFHWDGPTRDPRTGKLVAS